MSNNTFVTSENIFSTLSESAFDDVFSDLINEFPSKIEREKFNSSHDSFDEYDKTLTEATSKKIESTELLDNQQLETKFLQHEINSLPFNFSEFPGNSCAFDNFCKRQPETVIQAIFPNKSYKQLYDMFINYDTDHVCKFEMPLTLKVCEKLIFYKAMKSNDSILPKEFKKHFNERKYRILGNDIFAMIVAKLNVFTCDDISKYTNYKTEMLDSVEYELSKRTLYKSSNKSLPETTKAMMGKYNLQQLYFNSSFEKVAELLKINIETLEKIFQHIELLAKQLNILLQGDRKIELSKKKQNGENAKNIFIYNNQLCNFVEEQKGKYQTFEKKPLLVQARLISVLRYTLYNTFGWNAWVCWFLIRKKCYDLAQNYGRIRDNMIKKGRLEALGVSKILYQKKLYSKIIEHSKECKAAYQLDPYQITLFNESSFKDDVDRVNNEDCQNLEQFKKIYFNNETEFKELTNYDENFLIPKFKMADTSLQNREVSFANQFQFLKHHDKVQKQLIMSMYLLDDKSKSSDEGDAVYNSSYGLRKMQNSEISKTFISENANQLKKEKDADCLVEVNKVSNVDLTMLDGGFLEACEAFEIESTTKAEADKKRTIEKVDTDYNVDEGFGNNKRMRDHSSSIDTLDETLFSRICNDALITGKYEDNYVTEFEMNKSINGLYDSDSAVKFDNESTNAQIFNEDSAARKQHNRSYSLSDLNEVANKESYFSVTSTPTVFPEESIGRLFGEFFNSKGLITNQENPEQTKQHTIGDFSWDLDLAAEISFDYPAEFRIF